MKKDMRDMKLILEYLTKAAKNLETCDTTKFKVLENNQHLLFCDRDGESLFKVVETNDEDSVQVFKDIRLKFLDEYKKLWIKQTKSLYKELGEVLNEKHSMDLDTILSTPEHEPEPVEGEPIPF
jgi:hypothetical protein